MLRRRIAPLSLALSLALSVAACKDAPSTTSEGADKSAEAEKAEKVEGEKAEGEAQEEPAPAQDDQVEDANAQAPAEPAAAAVDGGEDGEEAPAGAEASTAKLAESAEKDFELLEAGSGDKKLLRFAPKVGQVERMEMTMTMEISLDFGAMMPPQTQKTPPMKMVNKAETTAVADGKITTRVIFESFDVDTTAAGANAAMAEAMKTAMTQIQGFEQLMTYDDRGGVLEGDLKIPAGADPQVAQSLQNLGNTLEQVMIHFPEQAVGTGAKWRETVELDNNGMQIKQVSEYELVEIDGDTIKLESSIEQEPASKDFEAPGMPPGVEVDLVEFDSKGKGEIVYALGNMFPESGKSNMDTKVSLSADAGGGKKQEFTTRIKLQLEVARVDDASK
ncbi:hypothetical protein G6O69_01375 [Pseudenhygromyxa sp. WMMC2535]|uniref:DUF6263 family protein n=1 Tax=Pseudenhygromyxa sp. WMMC2535 TaxID=2712867 RepID=UPI00155472E1|nr:DUF6263 family protein [Pseudenhygromyxa sp. WMMC2535]NVB36463.1 hypothetical protein [Pseudenhygromyxa sp. WMMC2535]